MFLCRHDQREGGGHRRGLAGKFTKITSLRHHLLLDTLRFWTPEAKSGSKTNFMVTIWISSFYHQCVHNHVIFLSCHFPLFRGNLSEGTGNLVLDLRTGSAEGGKVRAFQPLCTGLTSASWQGLTYREEVKQTDIPVRNPPDTYGLISGETGSGGVGVEPGVEAKLAWLLLKLHHLFIAFFKVSILWRFFSLSFQLDFFFVSYRLHCHY